jgi:DNA-binding IclR family transcriptional regulator
MIEKLFAILKDGEWHDLTYLSEQIGVPPDRLTEFLQFLSKEGIVTYKDKTHRIKIKPEWQNILPEET